YSQQWNMGYAQQIGRNAVIEFDYVHILGLHEFTSLDVNPRTGPLNNAQRTNPASAFPRVLAPLFAAHAAELTAAFGTASPFARITAAQSVRRLRLEVGLPTRADPATRKPTRLQHLPVVRLRYQPRRRDG